MKPFTIPSNEQDGRLRFEVQLEGISSKISFAKIVLNNEVAAIKIPVGHTLEAAWLCRLLLADGGFFEFSSACTQVDGWHEVGSLNIEFCPDHASDKKKSIGWIDALNLPFPQRITNLDLLVYEDEEVICECGLRLLLREKSIYIAAGIPPGSVSIADEESMASFQPQFDLGACKLIEI